MTTATIESLAREVQVLRDKLALAEGREKALREALEDILRGAWDPDESDLEFYERVAEEFYRATGYMRPGKDDRSNSHTPEERQKRWGEWIRERARARIAKGRAALRDSEVSRG